MTYFAEKGWHTDHCGRYVPTAARRRPEVSDFFSSQSYFHYSLWARKKKNKTKKTIIDESHVRS